MFIGKYHLLITIFMAIIGTSNISVQGIGQTLNNAGGSVDINKPLEFFTSSANRNKWSKRKPINHISPFFETINDTITVVNPITLSSQTVPWYFGDLSTKSITNATLYSICGIYIPIVNSIADSTIVSIIDNYSTNGANWELVPISDGNPKRLGDFRGYSTDVGSPLYTYAKTPVYLGSEENAYFQVSDESEDSEYGIGMAEISTILDDSFERGVILTKNGTVVGYYGSDEPITNGGIGASWNVRLSEGVYKVYFVAKSASKEKTLPYPSTSQYPNPVTIEVLSSINPLNNPFNQLSYDLYGEGGFAYNNSMGYFEPMYNINENNYTTLNTTGSFCFYIDFTAIEQTTLDFSNVYFRWLWTGSSDSEGGRPGYRPIINGANYSNSSYTFTAGVKTRVYFQFDDIFYDSYNDSRYEPSEDEQMSIDQMVMYYNTASVEYIDMDITYSSAHNGYFYNSINGYYQSK